LNQVLRGGARAVLSSSGNRQLGRIVPVKDDLYSFRPESGYQDLHVQRGSDWVAAPDHGEGGAEVAAHRSYRLRDSDGRHHYFRIEYDSAPRNPR
jgi:hypothetical protein